MPGTNGRDTKLPFGLRSVGIQFPIAATIYGMSLFWLSYRRHGKPAGVVLIEAPDLKQARFRAAVEGQDQDADFAAGHGLNDEIAARIPAAVVGRMLTAPEARKLLRHLERTEPTPKRPPARSVRRRDSRSARRPSSR
jgi:hypothetical protein